MAETIASLQAIIGADVSGLQKGLKSAQGMLNDTADQMKSVGGALTAGLTLPIIGFGVASLKSFSDSESALTQLNAVLKSTRGVAGVTAKSAEDLAKSLQSVTRYSDEAVLGAENILLTFTNINKNIFPETTELVLDMSQALGQDLKSSAIQLGKALQDPVTGITALRRVGVNFTEAQVKQIKALVASGQTLKAQKLILQELKTEFGGSARAAGQTFAGSIDRLKNKFDDFMEVIGGKLAPTLEKFIGFLSELVDKLQNVDPAIINIGIGVAAFAAAIGPVVGFVGTLVGAIGALLSIINPVTIAIAALGAAFATNFMGIRDLVMPLVDSLINIFRNLATALSNIWGGNADIGAKISRSLDTLKIAFEDALGAILNWVNTTFPQIGQALTDFKTNFIDPTISVLQDLWTLAEPYLTQLRDWFITDALPKISLALALFNALVVQPAIKALQGIWNQAGPSLRDFAAWFHNNLPAIQATVAQFVTIITTKIKELMTTIQAALGKLDQLRTQGTAVAGVLGIGGQAPQVTGTTVGAAPSSGGGGGNIIGNLLKGIFGRDSGGMGAAGKPVMIGAGAQPELFVPSTAGNFFPAGAMAGAGGGGYNGPSTISVELNAEGFRELIHVDVATAFRKKRQ